jgi:threonine dehydratase
MELPAAARRLCRVTPLVWAAPLGAWLKLESLQATGSFKQRGAAVKLARAAADGARHVVAASAGNHGQGVARAARALRLAATVVVPQTTPAVKREGIARWGAELRVHGRGYDEAEAQARALAVERGAVFVSPYDDEDVIDGNGRWLAAELLEQRRTLRQIVAPVGGGGLAGGLAETLVPRGVRVVGVQPRANCAMHRSLELGAAQTSYTGGETLCEGLEGAVAVRTFELARAHLAAIVLVEEAEVLAAMAFAYRALGLIVEPSAAVGIAAARAGRLAVDDETALIVTGSNVEPELLDQALAYCGGGASQA